MLYADQPYLIAANQNLARTNTPGGMDQNEKSLNISNETKDHYNLYISLLSFFPLLSTVFLLCSCSNILNLICADSTVDVHIEFGQWSLFYSLALTAPSASFLSHTMSAGWMVLSGSIVIFSGLITALFCPKSTQQIMLFSVSTGIGTALIFHGAYVVLSHRYARQSVFSSILMLLTFMAVIIHAEPLLDKMSTLSEVGMLIGVIFIFTCVLPAKEMIKESSRTSQAVGELLDDTPLPVTQSQTTLLYQYPDGQDKHAVPSYTALLTGWILSFIWWAIGINLTWTNDSDPRVIIRTGSIQCILSLLCFCTQYFTASHSGTCKTRTERLTPIDNDLLLLGLIGSACMTVIMWPDYTTCGNYLLFIVGYVVQVIDFSSSLSAISCILPQKAGLTNASCKLVVLRDKSDVPQITTFISCRAFMTFFVAVIFYLLIRPVAYTVILVIMSYDLGFVKDVIILTVLSCAALLISVIQPGRKNYNLTDCYLARKEEMDLSV